VHAVAGARRQDVQPAPAVLAVERPEVVPDPAVRPPAVGDAEEDDVALVALDVLQVLDEEGLGEAAVEEGLQGRLVAPPLLQLILDGELLPQVEGADAERPPALPAPLPRELLAGEADHLIRDPPRLGEVEPLTFVNTFGDVFELQPQRPRVGLDAREGIEIAVVERNVRKMDQ
jgi:hypothetical protein